MNHGKHYVDSKKLVDRTKLYDTEEALALCCQTAKAKFDETVELHVRLGVDSRHADQQVRVTAVNAQFYMNFNGFIKFGGSGLYAKIECLIGIIKF